MKIVRSAEGKFRFVKLSAAEYSQMNDGSDGLCVACGDSPGGCEPDMHEAHCGACGAMGVYGIEELLLMGRVKVAGEMAEAA